MNELAEAFKQKPERNLPITVTGFNIAGDEPGKHLIEGVCLLSGHKMSASYRPIPTTASSGHNRRTMVQLARKVTLGNIVRLDGWRESGLSGHGNVHWITNMSGAKEVRITHISVLPPFVDQKGSPRIVVEEIMGNRSDDEPVGYIMTDWASFVSVVTEHLETQTHFVYVRDIDAKQFHRIKKADVNDGAKILVERMLQNGKKIDFFLARTHQIGKLTALKFQQNPKQSPHRWYEDIHGHPGFCLSSFDLVERAGTNSTYIREVRPVNEPSSPQSVAELRVAPNERHTHTESSED